MKDGIDLDFAFSGNTRLGKSSINLESELLRPSWTAKKSLDRAVQMKFDTG